MLDVNPETVCFIILKAREFQAKEGVILPEIASNATDDGALEVLADHQEDFTFQELQTTINDLEPDQQQQVVALMWLGRGDFTLEEWSDALAQAEDAYNARTAEYLIATPLLPDYLQDGLEQHGYSCD